VTKAKFIKEGNMRKTVLFILIAAMVMTAFTGCEKEPADIAAPAATAAPAGVPSAEPSAEPVATPDLGPRVFTPADIKGSRELNPFYDLTFPESFFVQDVIIRTPGWDGNEYETMSYTMYIIIPQDNESITAMLSILGIQDKGMISSYIAALETEQRIETKAGDDCDCLIYNTTKDGLEVELTSFIKGENEGNYLKFIEDNYNMNLFGAITGSINLLPIPGRFGIEAIYVDVNDMMKTSFEVAYTSGDLNSVMESILDGGEYSYYDSDNRIVRFDYGKMSGELRFDPDSGVVHIRQQCKGVPDTAMSSYEPPVTMDTYGFWFSPESGSSLFENHANGYNSLVFRSPDWGSADESLRMEFSYPFGKYRIYVWYRPNTYQVQIEKGNSSVTYFYDTQENILFDMHPDEETVEQFLGTLFADRETEESHLEVFRVLEQYVLDITGISFAEFVSLPPTEDYPVIDSVPTLPKPGDIKVTLQLLGFEYSDEEGMYRLYDEEADSSIHIYREEWKEQEQEWRKNVMLYFKHLERYDFSIKYYPDKGMFGAQMLEGEDSEDTPQSYFEYDLANDVMLDWVTRGSEYDA